MAAANTLLPVLRWLTVSGEVRDKLTQHLTALKEESKGQCLDLADMGDASKAVTRALQEAVLASSVDDAQFKAKTATLSASAKAYHMRLNNLQNEARSIQTEVDAILKLLWGTDNPRGASFAQPPPSSASTTVGPSGDAVPSAGESSGEGFDVEPPAVSRILESGPAPPKVERVEGERVVEPVRASRAEATKSEGGDEAVEVETIEIEVEPAESSGSTPSATTEQDDHVETMKITDITKELYERAVNFADCLDARSLRQRYRDVLSGKISSGYPGGAPGKASASPPTADDPSSSTQPRTPPRPPYQRQYQQPPPNTQESGLASDPYPNAVRKMMDPMKHVWEVKQEIAAEKGIDPASVDLWSGKTKLEESKRLYDYPSIQSYPIEVRQKGDVPR